MSDKAARGVSIRRTATPSVHNRAQPSERSRYAHNVTRDAARLRRGTKPANLSLITIARRFSPLPFTMPTASSVTRLHLGVVPAEQDVRAGGDLQRLPQCAHGKSASRGQYALRQLSPPDQIRHCLAPQPHACERWRSLCRLSHAGDQLHGGRSPARPQPARAAPGSIRHARHAKRVHRLSHEPHRELGGFAGEGVVWTRATGVPAVCGGICCRRFERHQIGRINCAPLPTTARSQPIVRATALANLDASASQATLDVSLEACAIRILLVRLGALQSLASTPPDVRLPLVAPLLSDPLKALRIEAASLLAGVPIEATQGNGHAAFERAAGEFVETQRYNADRVEARVNLGTFYGSRGDVVKAEQELKAAIRLEPSFAPAYVNLADLIPRPRTRRRG